MVVILPCLDGTYLADGPGIELSEEGVRIQCDFAGRGAMVIGVEEAGGECGGKGKERVSADLRCGCAGRANRERSFVGVGWSSRGWRAGGEQGAMPVWFCFQKVSVVEYLLVHRVYGSGGGFGCGGAGRKRGQAVGEADRERERDGEVLLRGPGRWSWER